MKLFTAYEQLNRLDFFFELHKQDRLDTRQYKTLNKYRFKLVSYNSHVYFCVSDCNYLGSFLLPTLRYDTIYP